MKITKARLKEIINEELEREMARDPEEPDFSVSGAEDLRRSIAQDQSGRLSHAGEVGFMRAKLNAANSRLDVAHEKAKLHGQTPEIVEIIDNLKATIEELEYMLEFPD